MKFDEALTSYLPVAINLQNKRILIVGGGKVAAQKLRTLIKFTKEIRVVAKTFSEELNHYPILKAEKPYDTADIQDAELIYACTDNKRVNQQVAKDAKLKGKLVNLADNPEFSDFISSAIYQHGDVTISVNSGGQKVKKSVQLRNKIRQWLEGSSS